MVSDGEVMLRTVCTGNRSHFLPRASRLASLAKNGPPNRFCARRAPQKMVERIGIEPMTPCLQSRCSPS